MEIKEPCDRWEECYHYNEMADKHHTYCEYCRYYKDKDHDSKCSWFRSKNSKSYKKRMKFIEYARMMGNKNSKMVECSTEIVDMILNGASNEEIAKMVEFSKKVIDEEKEKKDD